MSLNRRRFVESASLTLLASAALPTAFAQHISGRKGDPFNPENPDVLANASEENFKPFIGESFAVMKAGQRVDSLTLVEVTAAAPPPSASNAGTAPGLPRVPTPAVTSFSLRFRGLGASILPEGTYTVKNRVLGSFPLFLSATGPATDPRRYTATFTLLVP